MEPASDLVDAYLERLDARLRKEMSPEAATVHVRLVRIRLQQEIADRLEQGESEHGGTIAALRRSGSERLLAERLIRTHFQVDSVPTWRFSALPIALLLMSMLVPFMFFTRSPNPPWFTVTTRMLPFVFVIAFTESCWRSQRVLTKPLAVVLALVWVGVMVAPIVLSIADENQYRERSRLRIMRQSNAEIATASAIVRGDLDPPKFGTGMLAPPDYSRYKFTLPPGGWVNTTLQLKPTHNEARESWKANGPEYILGLKTMLHRRLQLIDAKRPLGLSMWRQILSSALLAAFLAGIWWLTRAINGLTLLLIDRRQKLIARRWSLENLTGVDSPAVEH